MRNSTRVSFFTLTAYFDTGDFKYFCFIIVMSLYFFKVGANMFLIVIICMNRSLHEPMYMFLCSLFVNELVGSTGLFPFLLFQILSDVHTVSAPLCFLQIFCLYIYSNIQFCNLAVMSYDRYLAICCPLQYSTRMTSNNVAILIALSWLYPFVTVLLLISLSSTLQLCGSIIDKVYCDNCSIVKLACSDTTVNNIYGLVCLCALALLVILIVNSYIKIFKVCFSGSRQMRQKALNTCIPHLASLLNFSCGGSFEILQNRFDMRHLPNVMHIFLSLYWLTCQPLFNPVVYGLNLTKIRITCKNIIFGKI
ncbi:olfactory receptor 4B13-like [Pholidichthys leucotaenia]